MPYVPWNASTTETATHTKNHLATSMLDSLFLYLHLWPLILSVLVIYWSMILHICVIVIKVKDYDAALDMELESMDKFVLQCLAFYQRCGQESIRVEKCGDFSG